MEDVKQTTDRLIELLTAEGFPAGQLQEQIANGLPMNMPVFHAFCSVDYDEERMDYRLTFRQVQGEELPYRFTDLHAVHREAIDIETEDINGVKIADLDIAMASVDWHHYFGDLNRHMVADKHTETILANLRSLSDDSYARGKFFQQCLMLKHWPEQIFQQYRDLDGIDLKGKHEHRYTFKTSQGDILNAHLAYHIMSERYDSLRHIIEGIGLQDLGGTSPAYDQLAAFLCKNADRFGLDGYLSLPEGYVSFTVPVNKINGWYSIQEYQLTLIPYPEINHGVFNGIDSRELEREMMKINWKNDQQLFIFHKNHEPEFRGKVYDIQDQLYRIGQDLAGAEVADLLRIKYLTGVTYFGDNIDQRAWDRLDELPKRSRKFPADQDITSAINLLAGRAAFASIGPEHTDNVRHWCRLDLTDADGGYPMHSFESYSRQELIHLLRPLVYHDEAADLLAVDLLKGKQVTVCVPPGKNIFLVADPERKSLNIFTEDMRPIPVNLHLDPDWIAGPAQRPVNPAHKQPRKLSSPHCRNGKRH